MSFVSNYNNSNSKLDLYQLFGKNGERPLSAQKSSEIKEYLNKTQNTTTPENDTFTRTQATEEYQQNNKDTYSRASLFKNLKNNLTTQAQNNNVSSVASNTSTANDSKQEISLPFNQTSNDNSMVSDEDNNNSQEFGNQVDNRQKSEKTTEQEDSKKSTSTNSHELTEEEQQKVQELKDRDQEVKTHENQHKAVGGQYAQAPSYTYENGPDGKKYVVDGEVQISIGEEKTPEQTIEKMRQVHKAALAPAQPSGADRSVASQAQQIMNKAQQELNSEALENNESKADNVEQDKKDIANNDDQSNEKVQVSKQEQENNSQIINTQNNSYNTQSNKGISSTRPNSSSSYSTSKGTTTSTSNNSATNSASANGTSFKSLSAKAQEQFKQTIANTYHNSYRSSGIGNSTFNYTF